jgi:hypothetical protein
VSEDVWVAFKELKSSRRLLWTKKWGSVDQLFKKSSTSWGYTVPCTSAFLYGLDAHLLHDNTKSENNGRGDPLRWPRDTLYPLKLALISPTSGGRSVGIVRLRTNPRSLNTTSLLLSRFSQLVGRTLEAEQSICLTQSTVWIY